MNVEKLQVPVRGRWITTPSGMKYRIGDKGNLLYEVPDVPQERIEHAVKLLAEMQARPGFKPHHFFRHPDLVDIPSPVLKNKINEYLERSEPVDPPDNPLFATAIDIRELVKDGVPPVKWHGAPRIFAKGHVTAVIGGGGSGKSGLMQELAALMVLKAPIEGLALPENDQLDDDVRLLYLDFENPLDVTEGRYARMKYDVGESDGLYYNSFPNIEPANTALGAEQILEYVEYHGINFVMIDTMSKTAEGRENDSETYTALARHLYTPCRRRGITLVILDHTGISGDRARGSSGKRDNVDHTLELTVLRRNKETGITQLQLRSDKDRSGDLDGAYITRYGKPGPEYRHVFSLEKPGVTGADILDAKGPDDIPALIAENIADFEGKPSVNQIRKWLSDKHHIGGSPNKLNPIIKRALSDIFGDDE
ncbi:RecA-superfamily ATPases implicated in signal transduction [Mycobacteroides abscessus subsp. massiliense]|uniref:AAA family ATPase n=1 Tax=Mycobacteroides abscessus TaxID=36809 RepID=UPI0009D1EE7D|nr:AAA family ATPase [Mycobacteroides abscessus]SLH43748.1 RecA-superfamily ATPases implicated in signal transduction [Mycobacteroides abscessus subsp. massiliense]